VIPLFNSLYDVCIICYTFNIYLTIFLMFVACYFNRFVVCVICLPDVHST
jgi:hypothetical protein